MFLNSSAKVHNNFDMRKYSIIKLLCLTVFKLSIYEKVENKRGKSPDASRTRAVLQIIICLKSRSHSVQNGPYKKRVERIINTRL